VSSARKTPQTAPAETAPDETAPDGMLPTASGPRDPAAGHARALAILGVDATDPAPAFVQLQRRLRIAIAEGLLQPGDRLPSVRQLARHLRVSPNTVGRAYADLSREGVIVAKAGGGSAVAPHERLNRPELERTRQERLAVLARQAAVRGLAMGFEPEQIAGALARELAIHGRPLPPNAPPAPLGPDEVPLLSVRNRLRGTVSAVRASDLLAEVTLEVTNATVVATITRASLDKLALEPGRRASAFVKATELTLGP
jgi:molybdopterin-binding protein